MGLSCTWLVNALAFSLLSVHAQLPKNGGLTDERPTYGSPEEAVYALVEPKLKTQWTDGVAADPDNAWPEYPRPGLQRDNWLNLNGVWEFQSANSSDDISNVPVGTTLEQRILVPFCIESGLSGVAVQSPFSWYRTSFDIPESFEENVILHFAAVDYETTVFVNGERVGSHIGGFDKFWFDVTDYVNKDSENELILFVYDPTDDFDEVIPLGKQRVVPSHIFYTPCSGIWQTVSIEAVPASEYITSIQLLAAADGSVTATIGTSSNSSGSSAEISFYDPANPSNVVFSTSGSTNEAFAFTVDPAPSVWSPDAPVVYNVSVTVGDDVARSYTAFRTVERAEVNGVPRYLLNGEPIFQFGPLDQGWWPDGLHTPPSYEAMIFDIQYVKDLGMNFIRKHIKVEPDTYYWAAANIGVLVMQDMPALSDARKPNAEQQTEWERQLEVLFKSLMGFPAITSFVIYNEGWGQLSSGPEIYLAPRVAEWLQGHQLVNAVSGWNDYGQINGTSVGDFHDNHHYSSPQCGTPFSSLASLPYLGDRIGFQGEFGGVGVNTSIDHLWNDVEAIRDIPQTYEIDATVDVWNYRALRVIEELREQTEMFGGCNGAVYTQTTDVEGEVNGFLTYDRAEDHVDHEKWEAAIAALYETFAASL